MLGAIVHPEPPVPVVAEPSEPVTVPSLGDRLRMWLGLGEHGPIAIPTWGKIGLPLAAAAAAVLAVLMTSTNGTPYAPGMVASLTPAAITATLDRPHPLGVARGPTVAATDEGRAVRLGVRVVDPEQELTTRLLGVHPVDHRRADVSKVQPARWGRGKTYAKSHESILEVRRKTVAVGHGVSAVAHQRTLA